MYKRILKNGFAIESFEELNSPTLISATTTAGGNGFNLALHTGADRDDAIRNRRALFSTLGIDPVSIVTANQIHSDIILIVGEEERGSGAIDHTEARDGDALITSTKGLPLMIFTADCAPILLYDKAKEVIGLVHAGWKGTQLGILNKTIARMSKEYGTRPETIQIGLGPMIRECCYQVSEDFREKFKGKHLTEQKGVLYFDLVESNREQAIDQGVPSEQIFDSGACTVCGPGYHSYRGKKTTSRMGTFIMMK
jgi:polyphenol oxidase